MRIVGGKLYHSDEGSRRRARRGEGTPGTYRGTPGGQALAIGPRGERGTVCQAEGTSVSSPGEETANATI